MITFPISEVFYSIQGESGFAGFPCVMVRFTGCNLSCSYCDTRYAHVSGDEWEFEQLIACIRQFQCPLVELTGGEPLLQPHIKELTEVLLDLKYTVLIETNGTCDIRSLSQDIIFIMDVKCPGSGHNDVFCLDNLSAMKAQDELKFVLCNRDDYEWAKQFLKTHTLRGKAQIVFSPVWETLKSHDLAVWMLRDGLHDVRLQLQLHKIIWGPEKRGV